jgi:hypothetical protein
LIETGTARKRLTDVPSWLPGVPINLAGWRIEGQEYGHEGFRMRLRV